MVKPAKRIRDDEDDDDRDDERPAKKKSKKDAKGSNTMLYVLVGGGIAVVGLFCLCGGVGGAGYFLGWFGGEKKTVAKAGDKGKEKDKDKGGNPIVDQGPPRGTGPLVTGANFEKAARNGKSLADIEKILGPGLPLKGADAEKAKKYQTYKSIRELRPNADAYQWSNDREVFFIFFTNGMWDGSGGALK